MKLHSHFGDSTAFKLHRAILIYGADTGGGHTAIATLHNIEPNAAGIPEIQPGACVSSEAVQDLALTLLEKSARLELLPPALLALGLKGMLWHCPPAINPIWFSPHTNKGESNPGKEALRKLSGDRVPHPHLLFHAKLHGLEVYALRGDSKPTPASRLYQAPYWNISEEGSLCIGTARIPKSPSPSHIPAIEKGFFESNFTHSNCHDHRLVDYPGGHDALWPSLKGKRRFPDTALVPLKHGKKPLKLSDLL